LTDTRATAAANTQWGELLPQARIIPVTIAAILAVATAIEYQRIIARFSSKRRALPPSLC
jgi:hypothetical protein